MEQRLSKGRKWMIDERQQIREGYDIGSSAEIDGNQTQDQRGINDTLNVNTEQVDDRFQLEDNS